MMVADIEPGTIVKDPKNVVFALIIENYEKNRELGSRGTTPKFPGVVKLK